mmetsp:Transcript_26038/g.56233  ORF Transcript_26038/g.56233 Transcript_26038/m.56233 type:complete len:758 (-) Transcript_26038:284-2557(-)
MVPRVAALLSAVGSAAATVVEPTPCSTPVQYEVVVENTWCPDVFESDYSEAMGCLPAARRSMIANDDDTPDQLCITDEFSAQSYHGAHTSRHFIVSHNAAFTFWETGVLPSADVCLAFTKGRPLGFIENLVKPAIQSGDVLDTYLWDQPNKGGIFDDDKLAITTNLLGIPACGAANAAVPPVANLEITVDEDHSYISEAHMVAPSPDAFSGISKVDLCENGFWVEELTINAPPYDAGCDSGTTFYQGMNSDGDKPLDPVENIVQTIPDGDGRRRLIAVPEVNNRDNKMFMQDGVVNPVEEYRIRLKGAYVPPDPVDPVTPDDPTDDIFPIENGCAPGCVPTDGPLGGRRLLFSTLPHKPDKNKCGPGCEPVTCPASYPYDDWLYFKRRSLIGTDLDRAPTGPGDPDFECSAEAESLADSIAPPPSVTADAVEMQEEIARMHTLRTEEACETAAEEVGVNQIITKFCCVGAPTDGPLQGRRLGGRSMIADGDGDDPVETCAELSTPPVRRRLIADGPSPTETAAGVCAAFASPPARRALIAEDEGDEGEVGDSSTAMYELARLVMSESEGYVGCAKRKFNYARPFQCDTDLNPCIKPPGHPSYPSGHMTQSQLMATLFSKVFESRSSDYEVLALSIGTNREAVGLHFGFDTKAGEEFAGDLYPVVISNACACANHCAALESGRRSMIADDPDGRNPCTPGHLPDTRRRSMIAGGDDPDDVCRLTASRRRSMIADDGNSTAPTLAPWSAVVSLCDLVTA